MTTCTHDPLFTHDGRCSKCHPRKRVVMVQHADGTREIDPEHMAELRDDDIATLEAMCSNDVKWTHYNSATEGA